MYNTLQLLIQSAGLLCALCGQIIYFNPARRTLQILNFIICLYRTVLEVNYGFHVHPKLFIAKVEIEWCPPPPNTSRFLDVCSMIILDV